MGPKFNRRRLMGGVAAATVMSAIPHVIRAQSSFAFGLPIAEFDALPGDGFLIRHGFQTENTWYNPGDWHCAEDWYRIEGDTSGASVLSVADGNVVFAGSDYPGRVAIVQHAPDLYSMYGHLDFDTLAVASGDPVERGQQLGTVLQRTDGAAPSHLHFEMRNFLYNAEVNGANPRYSYQCGVDCAPGPGYWPMSAPELPSGMGWRNPTHVIGNRLLLDGPLTVQAPANSSGPVEITTLPWQWADAVSAGTIELTPAARYAVQAVDAGQDASPGTSAGAYFLSYLIDVRSGPSGWIRAAVADPMETGADGRPSSVRFTLLPVIG